jgi:hypothetical protein
VALRDDFVPSPVVSASYDVDVDECVLGSATCDPNAECNNSWGSYSCSCNPGWSGDGWLCEPICGDGQMVGLELCDDGTSTSSDSDEDGCDSQCLPSAPGDRCSDALVASTGETLWIGWAGSHLSSDLASEWTATCLSDGPTPTADVFVAVQVVAGWNYSLSVADTDNDVQLLLRPGCSEEVAVCLAQSALLQPLVWQATADGTAVMQLVRSELVVGGPTAVLVTATPPVVEPDVVSGDDADDAVVMQRKGTDTLEVGSDAVEAGTDVLEVGPMP